jgi:hypothetical protein
MNPVVLISVAAYLILLGIATHIVSERDREYRATRMRHELR